MGGLSGIENIAGRGVGLLAALTSIKSGGLANYMLQRQRMMSDPTFRASLIDAPFTSGFFGLGGGPGPAAGVTQRVAQPTDGTPAPATVAAPQDVRYLPAGGEWYPGVAPLAYQQQVKEEQDRSTMIGLTSNDPAIRTQSKLAIGVPLSNEEVQQAIGSGREMVRMAGPGSQVQYKLPGGQVTVGSPYIAGNYLDANAAAVVAARTGGVVVPSPTGGYEVKTPERPVQGEYTDPAQAAAARQPGEITQPTGRTVNGVPTYRNVPAEKPVTPPVGPTVGTVRPAPPPPRVAAPPPEQPATPPSPPPPPRPAAPPPRPAAPPAPPPSPPPAAGPTFDPNATVPHTIVPAPEPGYPSPAPEEEKVGYPSPAPQPVAPVRPIPNLEAPAPVVAQPLAPPVAPALIERATPPPPAAVLPGREVAPGTPPGQAGPVLQGQTVEWKSGTKTYAAPGYEGADTEARKRVAGITDPRIDSPEKAKNLLDDERARAVQKDIDNADVTRLQRGMTESERAAEARLMTMKRAMDDFERTYPKPEDRAQFLGTVTWPWQTALDRLGWQGAKAADDFRASIGLFSKESLTDEKGKPLNPDLAGVASLAPSERDSAARFESQYQQMRDEVADELAIRSWLRQQPSGSVDANAYNRKLEQLQVDRAQRRVDALTPSPQAAAPAPSAPPTGTAEAAPPPPPAAPPWTPTWIH